MMKMILENSKEFIVSRCTERYEKRERNNNNTKVLIEIDEDKFTPDLTVELLATELSDDNLTNVRFVDGTGRSYSYANKTVENISKDMGNGFASITITLIDKNR